MLQTALLLFTTVSPPPDFADQVNRADVEISGTEVTITGYDRADQAIGSISYWPARDGTGVLVANYPDGYAQYTVTPDGELIVDSNLALEIVAERTEALGEYVDWTSMPQEGYFTCAAGIILSTAAAVHANPLTPLAMASTACACLPLIFKDGTECW